VALIKGGRELIPGDSDFGDPMSTTGTSPAHTLGRRAWTFNAGRLSLVAELALAGLQLADWLGEDVRGIASTEELSVLFTDLRAFSPWALEAGDEKAARLLRGVDAVVSTVVENHDGLVVKRLGDGAMTVFDDCPTAVDAAFEAIDEVDKVRVNGYRPQLRAGLHVGQPQRIGADYVGVDVNIASRLCEAADAGQVLISGLVRQRIAGRRPTNPAPGIRLRGVPAEVKVFLAEPS
jgi:adenylate cyclase